MNPAGTCEAPPPPSVIATPAFLRVGSGSCLPAPPGPMREKRNGGAAVAASALDTAAGAFVEQPLAEHEVAL